MSSAYTNQRVASVYHRVAAPLQFALPARDLVASLQPMAGARVLDVGTGTGAVARHALSAAGPAGLVVGIDAAVEMLRFARETAGYPIAAAHVPTLPFRDGVFEVVMAGFVVTHLADYDRGIAEMVRVCRPGGRIGVTCWGAGSNAAAQLWAETAGLYLPLERLDEAFCQHIPWDDWFSDAANLSRTLEDAGLRDVSVCTRTYQFTLATGDYLLSREAGVQGLTMRTLCTAATWDDFACRVAEAFRDRFGGTVEYIRDVHFGTGTRP